MSQRTTDLIQQGVTAARVGDIEEARRLLTQATNTNPNNIEAWLELAGVLESLEEKKECFSRVLSLDPNQSQAQAGLTLVEKKLAGQNAATTNIDTGLGICYRHLQTETGLRCNRCNKFICPKCAVRTPVGFRCPECIREQENKYYSGGNLDYGVAVVLALPLSFVAAVIFSFFFSRFGFFAWIIAFFAAPTAGAIISESVRWAVSKRRSRYLRHVVLTCLIIATVPFLLLTLLSGNMFGLIGPGILLFFGGATILARLR